MSYPSFNDLTATFTPQQILQLQAFAAYLQGYLSLEHLDSGAHGNITALSLTLANSAATATSSGSSGDATIGGSATVSGKVTASNDIIANSGVTDATGYPQQTALRRSSAGPQNAQTLGPSLELGLSSQDWSWGVVANELHVVGGAGRRQLVFVRRGIPDLNILALSTDDANTAGVYYLYSPVGAGATMHLGAPAGAVADNNTIGNIYGGGVFYERGRAVPMGEWTTYTPTTTNITLGNGSLTARYSVIGKTVHFYIVFTLGSTSAMGSDPIFTMPFTASSNVGTTPIGVGEAVQTGVSSNTITVRPISTTQMRPLIENASGTYVFEDLITASVPFTWGNTHVLNFSGTYEMA